MRAHINVEAIFLPAEKFMEKYVLSILAKMAMQSAISKTLEQPGDEVIHGLSCGESNIALNV